MAPDPADASLGRPAATLPVARPAEILDSLFLSVILLARRDRRNNLPLFNGVDGVTLERWERASRSRRASSILLLLKINNHRDPRFGSYFGLRLMTAGRFCREVTGVEGFIESVASTATRTRR